MTVRHSELAERVGTALREDPRTRDEAIDVADESGLVTLVGSVSCDDVRQAAEEIALHREGVVKVINELQVEGQDGEDKIVAASPPAHVLHGTLVSTRR